MEQKILKELNALKRSNILWRKHLIVCGDSFTEGSFIHWHDSEGRSEQDSPEIYDHVRQMYKTYPWWIAERNQMKLTNLAKCGGTMALTKEYLNSPDTVRKDLRHPFSNETYLNLGDAPDYILIMYGLNDMYCCELGTINDTTNETFYGAFNVVYKYLIQKYPKTKIGTIVSNAYLSPEFQTAVRETAIKWGIPYLDLFSDTGISATLNKEGMCEEAKRIRNEQFFVCDQNEHPNHIAHELMSTYVEDFLRRL